MADKLVRFNLKNVKLLLKLPTVSWALYDFANTAFAIVIITVIFPVFFTNVIAPEHLYGKNFGDLMWGAAGGASMLIAVFFAPIFGAVADSSRSKRKFLIVLTCICVLFVLLLYFTGSGTLVYAMLIFVIANIFYQLSMMFYNSFLPELSDKSNVGFISGFGFALGYMGGFFALLMIYPFLGRGLESENIPYLKLTFILTALYFIIFSLPSFLFLKDKPLSIDKKLPLRRESYLKVGFKRLSLTFKKMRKNKNLIRFLIAFFLFSNAFSILAAYAAIYGRNTLNLSLREIAFLFILGHFPVIISSVFFGWLVDKIGAKTVIIITLITWCAVIILITTINLKIVFYIVYILASVITGSTLIASRSLMSFLTPYDREAEYFSFYAIGGKFSAILGPVVFGLISYFTKNQRIALLSTIIFLLSGLAMIVMVKVPKERTD
ncbi:MAG: MFS transporter [Actinobacteria bacterium]|nr:MFS transporter [Actinomycetota bacterium]MBM3712582.1 MFS transporter [Actinomycetota bacterium]